MRVTIGISLGLLVTIILFSFYASMVHNQYFSDVASLDRNIEAGERCSSVFSVLSSYRASKPVEVFVKNDEISFRPEWQHKLSVASVISLSDSSTPFDTINYYVFCGESGNVLETYLVGD